MGNMGIYSVGTEIVYRIVQTGRTVCFAGVSPEGLTREILTKHSCLHLSWLFAFQSCAGHMYHLCRAYASFRRILSRELPAKTLLSSIAWVFTLSLYHTTLTIKSHNKYKVQKIEWNYNQIWHGIKPTKHIIVNYNFTHLILNLVLVNTCVCVCIYIYIYIYMYI